MKRTILSVAYPLTVVGPDAAGGSEQILTMLDRALTAEGHASLVIAAAGSRVSGTLIPSPPPPLELNDSVRATGRRAHRSLIRAALHKYPVDLVHMHALDFHHYVPGGKVPVLATLHLPPDWYPGEIFEKQRFRMNCVSRSQNRRCPASLNLVDPVPNGVDVDRLHLNLSKRSFVLSLGRICPEKGFHFALEACRRADEKVLLAGEIFPYPSHLEYFETEIKPRLDKDRRFIGPVGFAAKRRLLTQAKCLIVPSTVEETSSLVAMEALACGSPVIAFRRGALPEIVDHGRTGFIVSNVDQMIHALDRIDTISPEACRHAAQSRYSSRTMVSRYLALYEDLIEGKSAANQANCEWAAAS